MTHLITLNTEFGNNLIFVNPKHIVFISQEGGNEQPSSVYLSSMPNPIIVKQSMWDIYRLICIEYDTDSDLY